MKNKTKVAFCLRDMNVGGVESVLTRTLDKLQHYQDLDLVVITYTPIRDVWRDWFDAHPNITVRNLYPSSFLGTDLPHFFLTRIIKHFMRDVYRGLKRKFFNKHVFRDIDIAVDYYDFDCFQELKNLGIPRIAWWHSSSDKFNSGEYVSRLNNYEKFVVLTDAFADELKNKYPESQDKIVRIYNPIDIENVRKLSMSGLTHNGDYFVCVSRLVNGKDIETLMRAFDVFWNKNNGPAVDLLIVGDGYARNRFEEIAKSLPAASHIKFLGTVKNPFALMRGACANILSSFGEGFALVLIEGAAVETLNIASDCKNGPREILINGKAGLLFEPGNIDELAAHLDTAYQSGAGVVDMISCASENLNRFDATQIVGDIYKLLIVS